MPRRNRREDNQSRRIVGPTAKTCSAVHNSLDLENQSDRDAFNVIFTLSSLSGVSAWTFSSARTTSWPGNRPAPACCSRPWQSCATI